MCASLSALHTCRAPGEALCSLLESRADMRCHMIRCHISLYVAPLFEGTALILSHYSVRMHRRNGHRPLPQSRHLQCRQQWSCFLPLSSHPSTKQVPITAQCSPNKTPNTANFLSIVKEKMSAHTLNVSKCKNQCSKSIFVVKCTSTLIYSTE